LIENATDLTLTQKTPLNYFTGPTVSPILGITVNQTQIAGNGTKAIAPDDGDGILINVGTSQFGYIGASITNNHFSGNANIDFVTQSITTTAQPTVTTVFNASTTTTNTAFQPDPLARLALHLVGNVGDNIDVVRTGAFYGGTPTPDANKTIPGVWDGVTNNNLPTTFVFVAADETRRRNAQREPGVTNVGGSPVYGGAFTIGGIWFTQAEPTPTTVAATPVPSANGFAPSNGMIVNNNDYQNSLVTFSSGSDAGFTRVITASSTTSGFTVGQALPAAPTVGSTFTVNGAELAGTGASTFVTDSGPSVNTLNHFTTVITDFSNEAGFIAPNQTPGEGQFGFGWRTVPLGSFGSPFP